MRTRILLGIGSALAVAALAAILGKPTEAAEGVKLVIPAAAAQKTMEEDVKELQKVLGAAKVEKRDIRRAKVLAITIAINAQALLNAGQGDKGALGGQYATAVEILELLSKDDGLADAKKAAETFGSKKNNAIKPVDLIKYLQDGGEFDHDTAMQLFKSTRAGGLGIEKLIKDYSEKSPTAKDMAAISLAANRTAVVTQYLEQMAPKQDAGKKTKAAWVNFVQNARASAAEVANAANKKDPKAVKEALARMDVSCVGCHDVFKSK